MFHTFVQNNSGGVFFQTENVNNYVIVEGTDAVDINIRAGDIGIYFDGVDMMIDCDCCGNRWRRARDNHEMTDTPQCYSDPIDVTTFSDTFRPIRYTKRGKEQFHNTIIHYMDGRKLFGHLT